MFNYDDPHLPEHMRDGMRLYLERGIEPGSFLSAVIENDLKMACAQADHINQRKLWDIVYWLWNEAPSRAWGYSNAVRTWQDTLAEEKDHA